MALISFPNSPNIDYKGFAAFYTLESCQKKEIYLENMIIDMNLAIGNTTLYVDTFCLETYAFPNQLKEYEKQKKPKEMKWQHI